MVSIVKLICVDARKAWKKSPRTLNPSIHVNKNKEDNSNGMCALILTACCFSFHLFTQQENSRFTWIHGCWFSLFMPLQFPFINSPFKSFSSFHCRSSMFTCVINVNAFSIESVARRGLGRKQWKGSFDEEFLCKS